MGFFIHHYKIRKNSEEHFEVYYRDNIFCKWTLMQKYIGSQNGLVFVPAIFPTKEAAKSFISEVKRLFGKYDKSRRCKERNP